VYHHFVLQVTDLIIPNAYQNVVLLPSNLVEPHEIGYLLGWGSVTYPNPIFPTQLQKTFMRILPNDRCMDMFHFEMHVGQFCAYNREGIGPCTVSLFEHNIHIHILFCF
jgi:hypothetical protein